jgi:hypothetical protein
MYHANETNHRTKDYLINVEMKKEMEQDSAQPPHQPTPREVNHTMQWAPHHQWYSSSYPLHFPTQAYQNSPPPVPQVTNPTPNNTNPQVKTEANPTPPPPLSLPQPQAQEPL